MILNKYLFFSAWLGRCRMTLNKHFVQALHQLAVKANIAAEGAIRGAAAR